MMKRRVSSIISLILVVVMVVGVLPANKMNKVEAADKYVTVTVTAMYGYAYEVLGKINEQRRANGLGEVQMDVELLEAAMQRAAESVVVGEAYDHDEIGNTEAHTRPDGSKFNSWAYKTGSYGENVAYGQTSSTEVMKQWMNSSGHKANILKADYKSVGVGVVYCNGYYRFYWTQEFSSYSATVPSKRTDNVTRTFTVGVTNSVYNRLVSRGKLGYVIKSNSSDASSSGSGSSSGSSMSSKAVSGTWKQTNGRWWFQVGSSYLTNSWLKSGGTWYAFGSDGYMYTGWKKIDGDWYYFDSSGAMASSEWRDGYWLSSNGKWSYKYTGSWHVGSKGWWFGDSSGWYAQNQWQKINGSWYYFDASGWMVTNRRIQGYWIGADGVCQ